MWISMPAEKVLVELAVNPVVGLSDKEAAVRLAQSGLNKLQAQKKKNILQLLLAQLNDALIYVLFGAVTITLLLGKYVDATIIVCVILINAGLGVAQELKAGNAIEALKRLSAPRALVRRDGEVREIDSAGLVPGDIVLLDAGRFVPADVRLLESANLQIEESALTGESVPATKDARTTVDDPLTPLGNQANAAFMSTLVTAGRGLAVVVRTGMKTEVGKIARLIDQESESKTPLERELDELGKTLGKVAVGICTAMFMLAYFQGRDLATTFLLAVSLAVAAIPEGLAAIVAVVLSIGVTAMAGRNAIIKKLPAVETLGSVNIVCSDKTGTLTQNKMTVVRYYLPETEEVTLEAHGAAPTEEARLLAKAMILCSDATYEHGQGTGDPTEIALLMFGDQLGIDRKALAVNDKRVGELAFDSDRKLMSTLTDDHGQLQVFTKGAFDSLITRCTHVRENGRIISLTPAHRQHVAQSTEAMSGQALRTLAAAYKPVETVIRPEQMERELILLGLVGMMDPPRDEAKEAIRKAARAGITTVMITGDHKNTAFAVARELGLAQDLSQAITGEEINRYSDEEFARRLPQYRVFARVSPEHKVKIIRAFKAQGNIVSMTGDGVNDAPSLKAADIGVAMGITGTDVAKNAADMILADDNFATIITAIEQGRNIYNNVKKSVLFLLATNMGEVVATVVSILIGWPAPMIATQLLWINLLTDSVPAIALGMDPGDPDVMLENPREPNVSFFAGGAGLRVVLGGTLIGLLTMAAFWYGYYKHGYRPHEGGIPEAVDEYAHTMAFMTIVCCQLFYSFSFRSPIKSVFQVGLTSNKYLFGAVGLGLGLQLLALTVPFLQQAFKLQYLDVYGYLVVIGLGLTPLIVSELLKVTKRQQVKRMASLITKPLEA
jgi:Ca2+-transporting ATPase